MPYNIVHFILYLFIYMYSYSIQVSHVTVTYRDGRVAQMENVYVRGSKVRFIILPDMLRNAPMFKSKMTMGGAAGRGKSGMIRSSGISIIFFINCNMFLT